ncbi:N-6 DNA methylase [Promethearchaeum syntrophicum]|uniref:site-specific DNA-methyltransferase (adenine-specific) n=1 Tax=Promethearchaeum syntrophicum TaxID=2594042 RepID=A0A5B9D6A9_9ARCH|nr:N-6 DNA methylase [Candidatus Prometheoarchaeum syntrophicum]QEE14481.1 N-6 DNA Methylase [Candidatus Prometheoarchaeum syntrophicum]
MVKISPLEYISLSGGLFTENLILKIRDKPDTYEETRWRSFGENWQDEKKKYKEVWEWAKRSYDIFSKNIDDWSVEERFSKWIKPLLEKCGHIPKIKKKIDIDSLSEDEKDNILNKIIISHKFENTQKVVLHCCIDSNLDDRTESNYQKKSNHDHLQRYILLKEMVKWGFLTNGKKFRMLGEFSNIYSKGYIEIDLDSIIIGRNESEFKVFYMLIHSSRFNETYGLDVSIWMKKQEKLWQSLLKQHQKNPKTVYIDEIAMSKDTLKIFKTFLDDLIKKAHKSGLMSINSSESENFIKLLKDSDIELSSHGREFYLKIFEKIISDINENKSAFNRLQDRSQTEGVEVGKKLRKNVHNALELMGEDLIQSNSHFSEDIVKGDVDINEYFRELLRIAYRLIFILYAESKDLLPSANTIYQSEIGLTELRKKAELPIRTDQNRDLWERLKILFNFMYEGNTPLGINAFGGDLFNPDRTVIITGDKYGLALNNSTILSLIRELTIVEIDGALQRINYVEIGEEEIGGIYESLLDYMPRYVKKVSRTYHFILEPIDTERKGSGTYYTPKGLIDIILKTSLKPIVINKLHGLKTKKEKLDAILNLKICDPACGGGSFLLSALDYLGKKYAQIESNEEFPSEVFLRYARRNVLQHCIYGVDLNPMAIELAKISLWLKASVKNRPLTFLDNHLKLGNSLIGFSKKKEIGSIPIKSYNIVIGEKKTGIPNENRENLDKARGRLKTFKISSEKDTKKTIQTTLLEPFEKSDNLIKSAEKIYEMNEDNLLEQNRKIECYLKLKNTKSYINLNLQANLWTSSFFWNFRKKFVAITPTDKEINYAKKGILKNNSDIVIEVERLAKNYGFFNWFLEFPEVFQSDNSGFDCILMNPPWDVLVLLENEFFAGKSDYIINSQNRAERQLKIKELKEKNRELHDLYVSEFSRIKKTSHYFKFSKFYEKSSYGSLNLFALFIERSLSLINKSGNIGTIVPTTLITGDNLKSLFQYLYLKLKLKYAFNFINRLKIFPIGDKIQFSLITISNEENKNILMSFYTWKSQLLNNYLEIYEQGQEIDEFNRRIEEGGSLILLDSEDFELFNPNSKTSPLFRRTKDYFLVKKSYQRTIILEKERHFSPWKIKFNRILDSALASKHFKTAKYLENNGFIKKICKEKGRTWIKNEDSKKNTYLPLYSGSSIWFYDYRYNELIPRDDKKLKKKALQVKVTEDKHNNKEYCHLPMYWVNEKVFIDKKPENWDKKWYFGYRDISGTDNERSFIISVFPHSPFVSTLNVITTDKFRNEFICLIANLSSIIFDFIARNKISGIHFSQYIVKQLPVFPPEVYSKDLLFQIKKRVIELVYTSSEMNTFITDFGFKEELKPYNWKEERREKLKAELDAIFSLMYGYNRENLQYILNTFSRLRTNELKLLGEFRTKRLILESYDNFDSDPKLGPLFRLESINLKKINSNYLARSEIK